MPDNKEKKLNFIINVGFVAIIVVLVYLAFKYVLTLLLPFIIALILVSLLHPLIRFVNRKLKINQNLLSVILVGLLYLGVGGLMFGLIVKIVLLFRDALAKLPAFYESSIAPALYSLGDLLGRLISGLPEAWTVDFSGIRDSLLNGLNSFAVTVSQKGIDLVSNFINFVPAFFIGLLFTIMLSFFISMQYESILLFLKKQIPPKGKDFLSNFQTIMKDTVLKYVRAYLILMFITFIELSIGLLIIGTSNPIGTAAVIAIFDALPILGTGGIMIPWVVIELLKGNLSLAVGLAILYGVITLIRNIIEPKIVGDQLGLNPIVSLMAIYLGFRLFGIIGMIVFPILSQILLVLHSRGVIKLYR